MPPEVLTAFINDITNAERGESDEFSIDFDDVVAAETDTTQ